VGLRSKRNRLSPIQVCGDKSHDTGDGSARCTATGRPMISIWEGFGRRAAVYSSVLTGELKGHESCAARVQSPGLETAYRPPTWILRVPGDAPNSNRGGRRSLPTRGLRKRCHSYACDERTCTSVSDHLNSGCGEQQVHAGVTGSRFPSAISTLPSQRLVTCLSIGDVTSSPRYRLG
jgi:hypothetical protein